MGDIFAAFEVWLVSTGATASVMRLAWALLSVLWLGHVAVSTRPGREPDLIGAFARLILAGGLLSGIGEVTRAILLGFETFRSAGAAVLDGLIGQTWAQFVQGSLPSRISQLFETIPPFWRYPWGTVVLMTAVSVAVALFAAGAVVYLAILFFAHLTLLLAIFLSPLAVAMLASPSTQGFTVKWAVVVIRTALVVFCVRVVHAAVLYLAVVVPFRDITSPGSESVTLPSMLAQLGGFLFTTVLGTSVGVYAMFRVERLVTQFVDASSLAGNPLAGPMSFAVNNTAAFARGYVLGYIRDRRAAAANVVPEGGMSGEAAAIAESRAGGAQTATIFHGGRDRRM